MELYVGYFIATVTTQVKIAICKSCLEQSFPAFKAATPIYKTQACPSDQWRQQKSFHCFVQAVPLFKTLEKWFSQTAG